MGITREGEKRSKSGGVDGGLLVFWTARPLYRIAVLYWLLPSACLLTSADLLRPEHVTYLRSGLDVYAVGD